MKEWLKMMTKNGFGARDDCRVFIDVLMTRRMFCMLIHCESTGIYCSNENRGLCGKQLRVCNSLL
jgi:hypothetical protein